MGFSSVFLSIDMLGHAFGINYRGNATYNTYVGSILSICIYILVMVRLVDRTTDLIDMRDPSVSSMTRPMFIEESIDFGDINLNDFRFNIGVFFKSGKTKEKIQIPDSIGKVFVEEGRNGVDDADRNKDTIEPYAAI